MREIQFAVNHFYHVYSRGVDKRKIFMDEHDYQRFYVSMFLFNNSLFRAVTGRRSLSDVQIAHHSVMDKPREPLINILSFCLLPNHFHLLIEPLQEEGVTKFMHRLNMGYARYFNKRYDRIGCLFEGEFKAVLIKRDAQFEHVPRYIHLNALDMTDLNWREGKVEDWNIALRFLENYLWSSHRVYLGKSQLLPLLDHKEIFKIFKTPEQYLKFLRNWSVRDKLYITE